MKITNRHTGKAIHEGDYATMVGAVAACIAAGNSLQGANLQGSDLRGANLRGANLRASDLQGANLRGSDLWGADLRGSDLRGAYLWGADLRGSDLRGAYLRGADLRGANLRGADLRGADLQGADLPIRVISFGPCGSVKQMTLFLPAEDMVQSGCWSGTLADFKLKVPDLFRNFRETLALFTAGISLFEAAAAAESANPKPYPDLTDSP
jgi:Pentapeptide repeats (8 copies)